MYLKHVAKPLSRWITFSKMLQANRKKPDEEILSAISSAAHIRPAVNNATKTSQAKLDLEQMISPMSCIHQRSQFEKLHRRKKVKGSESAVLHKQGGSGIQDNQIVGNGGQASLIGQWEMGKPRGFRPKIDKGLTPCIDCMSKLECVGNPTRERACGRIPSPCSGTRVLDDIPFFNVTRLHDRCSKIGRWEMKEG